MLWRPQHVRSLFLPGVQDVLRGNGRDDSPEGLNAMGSRIEDYAIIGDCQTAALVGRDGSIDWLCLPRFDSPACFAALLGTPENGRWLLAPAGEVLGVRRRYRGDTLVLETEFETASGRAAVIDFMPPRTEAVDLIRIVEGRSGQVPMRFDFVVRFDYGSIVPWVRHVEGGIRATAGPDTALLFVGPPSRREHAHRRRLRRPCGSAARLRHDLVSHARPSAAGEG